MTYNNLWLNQSVNNFNLCMLKANYPPVRANLQLENNENQLQICPPLPLPRLSLLKIHSHLTKRHESQNQPQLTHQHLGVPDLRRGQHSNIPNT